MSLKKLLKNNVFMLVLSIAFMIALCIIAFVYSVKAGIISTILFICYIIYVMIYSYFGSGEIKNNLAGKSLASHTFNFISDMNVPVLLCDSRGSVSWYNNAFRELFSETTFKIGDSGKSISDDIDISRFEKACKDADSDNYILAKKDNRYFRIHPYYIETMRKNFWLAVWIDSTEHEELIKKHIDSNVLVAYAAVDNINELSSGIQQDRYREISAKIYNVLNDWVNSMHGIIKEYERDKYLIFFEDKYIGQQFESKFDILDKINDLSEDTDGVPLTVSIGIARVFGSGLDEKEEAAKNSLQLALQRGGAQVVVKNRNDNEFYGGRTKTIQKRTKIKSRVVANELVSLISKSSNVLIMGHANPDFDAIASCVGIARLAMSRGREVKIIEDLDNPNFSICREKLSGIKEYDKIFVDKVYGQELLKPDTLVVISDVSNVSIFESPEIYRNAENVVVIDHHRQTQEFTKNHAITYIEPTASSASELVAEMLEIVLPLNTLAKEEAELMLAGILLDTQNFTRNVGIRTFSAAMYLRGEGANTSSAQAMFKYQIGEFKKIAEFERNIFIFRKIFAITQYENDNDPENRITAAQVADRMLMIDGIHASFTVSKVENAIHISARSDGSVNVSLILEKIGGGGHFDSAGAKISGSSMKQAMSMLREAIVNYCDNN